MPDIQLHQPRMVCSGPAPHMPYSLCLAWQQHALENNLVATWLVGCGLEIQDVVVEIAGQASWHDAKHLATQLLESMPISMSRFAV
jgi:hypothetical protein